MDLTKARRIVILGISGGGKSTFARQLGAASGLPVIHLDREFWKPGWRETPRPEFRERVAKLCEADRWIMDGNFNSVLDIRMARAEAAVYFDSGRFTSVWNVLRRWRSSRGSTRSDMAEGCPEKVDLEFIWYILTFSRKQKPRTLACLAAHPEVPVWIVRSRRESASLLAQFQAS